MTVVLILLLIQGLMGALDNFWHHEMGGLPGRVSARREIALHAVREAVYAIVYLTFAWTTWNGAMAWVLAGLIGGEIIITLIDFVEEDRTRRLAPTERVLHTLLAIGFGVILACLAPVWLDWTRQPTGFVGTDHGLLSWACTAFGLGVGAWSVRNGFAAFSHRHAVTVQAPARPSGRTVLITGATGFIGAELVNERVRRGDRVVVLARDILAARARFPAGVLSYDDLAQIPSDMVIDTIINLAGAPVIGGVWTKARRAVLMASRLRTTRAVLTLAARLERKPEALINASAVGVYGDRGDESLTEAALPGHGFMSDLCHGWEVEALRGRALGLRVCMLRLGMVFDWSGGPLPMLALSNLFGLGMVFGSGRQWAPWISRADTLRLIDAAITDIRYDGPINAVAPDRATQEGFARTLAKVSHRPLFLRAPAWPMRAVLGEFSDLFLASQRVVPMRLHDLGFVYGDPTLAAFLDRRAARTTLAAAAPA